MSDKNLESQALSSESAASHRLNSVDILSGATQPAPTADQLRSNIEKDSTGNITGIKFGDAESIFNQSFTYADSGRGLTAYKDSNGFKLTSAAGNMRYEAGSIVGSDQADAVNLSSGQAFNRDPVWRSIGKLPRGK